jgi:hypothetical protein
MTQSQTPKRRLKLFKRVIAERYKGFEVGRQIGEAINDVSEDMVIASASSIIIDDDTEPEEREEAINAFAKDIMEMSANRIIAVAIACNY